MLQCDVSSLDEWVLALLLACRQLVRLHLCTFPCTLHDSHRVHGFLCHPIEYWVVCKGAVQQIHVPLMRVHSRANMNALLAVVYLVRLSSLTTSNISPRPHMFQAIVIA